MRTIRYAIVGFRNVGTALARHIAEVSPRVERNHNLRFQLVAALDSSGAAIDVDGFDAPALAAWKEGGRPLAEHERGRACPCHDTLFESGVECVAIALPTDRATATPGLAWARAALAAGAHVVLADKGPALLALPELEAEAARLGLQIGASATVGGALPTLSFARSELAGTELKEISAILNGTTNLILSTMRTTGASFNQALAEAQRLGIAEPDPSYDVQGWDTAVKLTILARSLLDPAALLARLERQGIDDLDSHMLDRAARTGGRIRLVGRARRVDDDVRLSVKPEIVDSTDPFFVVDGAKKAARFITDLSDLVVMGRADGRKDVASAMLKDMIRCVC